MFGSTSLEVATGLVFIFLLLSLLVTALGEILASLLNARAKCLWRGVSALLENSGGQTASEESWTAKLYAHPIMRPLFPLAIQGQEMELGPKGKGPSYIPGRSFAVALLDITGITNPHVNEWQRKLQAQLAAIPEGEGSAAAVRQAVKSVADEIAAALDGAQLKTDLQKVAARLIEPGPEDLTVGTRLTSILRQITGDALSHLRQPLLALAKSPNPEDLQRIIQQLPAAGADSAAARYGLLSLLQRLETDPAALATAKAFADGIAGRYARQALTTLENDDLRQLLLTLLDEAQGDVEKLKTHVEDWFNHSMDRVTGWYKRETLWIHLGIAAVLAVIMNVDTLLVLRHLSADPALRQSVLAQVENFDKNPPAAIQPAVMLVPTGDSAQTLTAKQPSAQTFSQATSDYKSQRAQLLALGLPIGWTPPLPAKTENAFDEFSARPSLSRLLTPEKTEWLGLGRTVRYHLIGWLFTIAAASLGAPFWFDLLNKFMNIRASGKPPEKPAAR